MFSAADLEPPGAIEALEGKLEACCFAESTLGGVEMKYRARWVGGLWVAGRGLEVSVMRPGLLEALLMISGLVGEEGLEPALEVGEMLEA